MSSIAGEGQPYRRCEGKSGDRAEDAEQVTDGLKLAAQFETLGQGYAQPAVEAHAEFKVGQERIGLQVPQGIKTGGGAGSDFEINGADGASAWLVTATDAFCPAFRP
jgi:hypothetical protein